MIGFHYLRKINLIFVLSAILPIANNCNAQIITTYAGNGFYGNTGDGGFAIAAKIGEPCRLAFDSSGNLFIAGQTVCTIRKVSPTGIISAVAGTGVAGYGGDGGPATAAMIYWPEGVATDRRGNIYIADQFNNRIRKVDTNNIISTIVGSGSIGYSGDGGAATLAALWHPSSVGLDCAGNLYFTDQDNNAVRKVDTSGIITTIAGNGTSGFGGDGGPATAAVLSFPEALTVDCSGNVYIADLYNYRIRKISVSGIITTIAGGATGGLGDGGPATAAFIQEASAVCLDKVGNVYIGDLGHATVRKVDTLGIITTIAGNDTFGYRGDCDSATKAELSFIQGLATDKDGHVYISDFNNNRIRKISDIGCATTNVEYAILPLPEFSIFPIPSNGKFTLQTNEQGEYKLEVYNPIGKIIFYKETNSEQTIIDLLGQPAGVYFLHFLSQNANFIQKIIIAY